MKKSIFLLIYIISACFFGCSSDKRSDEVVDLSPSQVSTASPIDTLSRIISIAQQQSRLFTSECQVHKVVLFTDESRLGGKLIDIPMPGERKIAIPIDIIVKGYIDFSDFSEENVLLKDSLCVITLPDPQLVISSSKIDHAATRQYVSMTRSRFSDAEISRLASQGKDSVAQHLAAYGILERSRESCARTLVPILTQMGYSESNVIVRFKKNYDDSEIRQLTTFQK